MHVRAADSLVRSSFTGHRLDDVGAGDEHLGHAAGHEHEVSQRGAVGRAARAGAEYNADLGDHAGRAGVTAEDAAVSGQGGDTFLDAGARPVVQ